MVVAADDASAGTRSANNTSSNKQMPNVLGRCKNDLVKVSTKGKTKDGCVRSLGKKKIRQGPAQLGGERKRWSMTGLNRRPSHY